MGNGDTRIPGSRNAFRGYPGRMTAHVRIAAAGDVHAVEPLRERLARAFETAAEECDLVLLAGDLTTHGLPEQAAVLADACDAISVPVVAVLGNHDYHSGHAAEVAAELERGGVVVLDRGHTVLEVGEVEVGVVGTKGFVGGFPGAEIPDFGEPLLRQIYQETSAEVEALEVGLEAVAGCHKRIVLLHYAPIVETIVGEPEAIWAFLGSGRLAGPIGMHRPELVVHGHAHHGVATGAIGTVPVHNVAVHVTGQDFVVFTI
jgi:Icc-related predicted phosphoesterase